MNTHLEHRDGRVYFVIADAADRYHGVLRELAYSNFDGGFAKSFPEDTPNIHRIYGNFDLYAEEMVLQTAGERPVPWDRALHTFLKAIGGYEFDWWLCGSAALAARGLAVQPRDVDLVIMNGGAPRLAAALSDYLVEPLVDSRGWICDWFARAFIHCRLEWIGDPHESADGDAPADFGLLAARRLETIRWQRQLIRVPPLDMQLATCRRRGLDQRAKIIKAAMAQ